MSARPPPPPPSTSAATPKPKPSTSKTPSTSKPSMSKSTTPKAAPRPRSPETHLDFNTRNNAAEILQSYEQLAWYALARNESLSQTALHFKSVLSGFTASDRTSLTDWSTDTAPHDPSKYFHSHLAAAGLEEPLGGEGRRKCSSSASTGKGKERESGRGSLGGEGSGRKSLGRESPRGSLGGGGAEGSGSGSGRKKRRSGVGV